MRTPVILQRTVYECGYAVLAMLFSAGDSKITVNQLIANSSDDVNIQSVGRDGTSLADLKSLAKQNKADLKVYKVSDVKAFKDSQKLNKPLLAYVNNNHYVVINEIRKQFIHIIDPQSGKRRVSIEEFEGMYSGYLGVLIKTQKNKQIFKKEKSHILKLISWVFPHKKLLMMVIFISLIYQVLNLVYPLAAQQIVDNNSFIFSSSIPFVVLLLILLAMSGFYFGMNTVQSKLLTSLQLKINEKMTSEYITKIFRVPLQFVENNSIGSFSNSLSNIQVIRDILTNLSSSLFINISLIIIYSTILLIYSVPLFLVVCTFVLIQILVLVYYLDKISEYSSKEVHDNSLFQNHFLESIRCYNYIKTTGDSSSIINVILNAFKNQLSAYKQRMDVSIMLGSISATIQWVLPIVVFVIGVTQQEYLSISLGQLIGFSTITMRFLAPIGSIFDISQSLKIVEQMYDRIDHVLSQKEENLQGIMMDKIQEDIVLKNVSFNYGATTILENINLNIQSGEKILIRGRTGEGKTTLFKVISGLYTPTQGELLLGTTPYSQINLDSLRKNIGYITQENNLISGTIFDNIVLFNKNVSLEDVKKAATLACIDKEIELFPMKYDTVVGDSGTSLSGGQRQRIAIARTLVTNPQLLLIDEGTSNLDMETEQEIVQNLFSLPITILFISHRHKNIEGIDKIYSLENKGIHLVTNVEKTYMEQSTLFPI